MAQLILLLAMLVLLWALLIRPQRSRQRQQQEVLSAVEPGDEIITVGGLYGIVQEIDGVVKPDDEPDEDEDVSEEADEHEDDHDEAHAEALDEGSERESEVFVKDDDPESPVPLERR